MDQILKVILKMKIYLKKLKANIRIANSIETMENETLETESLLGFSKRDLKALFNDITDD